MLCRMPLLPWTRILFDKWRTSTCGFKKHAVPPRKDHPGMHKPTLRTEVRWAHGLRPRSASNKPPYRGWSTTFDPKLRRDDHNHQGDDNDKPLLVHSSIRELTELEKERTGLRSADEAKWMWQHDFQAVAVPLVILLLGIEDICILPSWKKITRHPLERLHKVGRQLEKTIPTHLIQAAFGGENSDVTVISSSWSSTHTLKFLLQLFDCDHLSSRLLFFGAEGIICLCSPFLTRSVQDVTTSLELRFYHDVLDLVKNVLMLSHLFRISLEFLSSLLSRETVSCHFLFPAHELRNFEVLTSG